MKRSPPTTETERLERATPGVFSSVIARRLIFYVVLFSSLITLVSTAFQLYLDYENDIGLIEDKLQQVRTAHLKSLSETLWASDSRELRTHADGILQMRDMQYVEIRDRERVWVALGEPQSHNVIRREFPMTHPFRGRDIDIGTLTIVASLDGVYQRLLDKVWIILASNAVKTFLVAGFIFIIFHTLVTRHLAHIASFARRLDADTLDAPLQLERGGREKQAADELDLVVNAIRQMQLNLHRSFEALRESEHLVRLLMDSTAEAIYGVDTDGRCTFANPACLRMLGYADIYDLLGQNMHELVHHTRPDGSHYAERDCHIYRAFRLGHGTHRDDEVLWRRDGSSFPVEYWSHPIEKDGETLGAVVTFLDISQRKQAEQELEKYREHLEELVQERTTELARINRELEAFSYSVSHDLRAPLRSIDGFSFALLEDYGEQLDEQGRQYLQRVRKSSQRMAELIDDLLLLSRVTRSDFVRQRLSLSELAQQAVERLQLNDPQRELEVVIETGIEAEGDRRLLAILFDNLIGNAWKYTGRTARPRIRFGTRPGEGAPVYFVEDNGAGFDMRYADKLFSAFQRLHGDEFEGSGIGLATARRIVERHGGRIWAMGEPGRGATFLFTLETQRTVPGTAT